jgi:5-methylcytosine-specific restriction endonuclease McrA
MKGKRLSDNAYTPEAIEKKGKAIRGDKHWNWQGGKTSKEKRIRVSRKYMVWRKAVFERDNYTCVWCGDRSAKGNPVILHADHIKPFAFYPRLRFKVENGRVLCIDCHKKTDTYLRNKNPKTLTI